MLSPAGGLACSGILTIMVAGVPGGVSLSFSHFTLATLYAPGRPGDTDFFSCGCNVHKCGLVACLMACLVACLVACFMACL